MCDFHLSLQVEQNAFCQLIKALCVLFVDDFIHLCFRHPCEPQLYRTFGF